jgi:pimeloyl-ACP methyl ester carboxylesterase
MSSENQRFRINDLHFNVRIEGEGTPILLLHGFPDSSHMWRDVAPRLAAAGYQVIAPDQRGFGRSSAPTGVANYRIGHLVSDAIGLLEVIGAEKAHLVGHDWGAVVAWYLAGLHGDRFHSLTAISVGHPKAYATAGWEQKRKGWYTLFFQLRGLAERIISANDFANFRSWLKDYPEVDRWIEDLGRPGRLTAALNWYRANLTTVLFGKHPRCPLPTLGIWSSRDVALAESQMTRSELFVDGDWRYVRLDGLSHWIPLEDPEGLSRLILESPQTESPGPRIAAQ